MNVNETVNDIRAEVDEYLTSIGPSEFPSETQLEEFADEFVSAHKREMAKKDAEIASLHETIKRLEHENSVFFIDIDFLRSLVKELADALEYNECYRCTYNCATCTCKDHKNSLIAKAREVVK